jgi:hypothetical protein
MLPPNLLTSSALPEYVPMVSIISFIYQWNSLTHCHFMWVNVKWCVTEFHKSETLELRGMLAVENRLRYYHACSRNITTSFSTTFYQAVSVNTDVHVFQCGGFSNLILCSFKCLWPKTSFFRQTDRHDEPSSRFSQFCECTWKLNNEAKSTSKADHGIYKDFVHIIFSASLAWPTAWTWL